MKSIYLKMLFFLVLVFGGETSFAQNCYIRMSDASGLNTDNYQAALEVAACELIEVFSEEFQDDFKVYDFGFYLHNEVMEGSFSAVFDRMIDVVAAESPYYLIFAKQTDNSGIYTKFWVDLKLPENPDECFVRIDFIKASLYQILNSETDQYSYAQREIKAMEALMMVGCEICDNGIDDDGDGYVDCYDLDCVSINELEEREAERSSDVCYSLTELCINSIATFIANTENDHWMKENLAVLDWGFAFLAEHGCNEEVGSFVTDAFNLKKTDSLINLVRVEELYLFLLNDPNGLIETCPDYDLQTYSDLLNLEVPTSIINMLNSFGVCTYTPPGAGPSYYASPFPCFGLQPIEEGSSALVNMDYYAVEVTQIPDFDGDGNPDTKEQLYQEFRENFTRIVSGEMTVTITECLSPPGDINAWWIFMPYDTDIDLPLWESKAIGARFFIDAGANFPNNIAADKGAVMTIQENELNFIITTIYTPKSGSQPFAGNRMWGIRTNQEGNCEIYTRAIDRANPLPIVQAMALIPGFAECDDLDYFNIADRTWSNFQTKTAEFINNDDYGGIGVIKAPIAVHLDFKTVYEKLKSDTPVNFVSCQ